MQDKGIREFQQRRTEIMINIINKSCNTLLKKNIQITINTLTAEVIKNFENDNIDKRYLVSAQTISRDSKYNKIWKSFQKKQKSEFPTKNNIKNKEFEFTLRDKYDMLKQDYIELKDQYLYVIQENTKYIETIKSYNKNNTITDSISHEKSNNNVSQEILNFIKILLKNGPVMIIEKDDSIIIQNTLMRDNNKTIIDKNKWNNI